MTTTVASERIYLSPPHTSEGDFELLSQAFHSNWIAPLGPHVNAFEQEFAEKLDVPYAVALSSGTAALHLALKVAGVKPGDEVLTSTLTFVATVNAIRYCEAKPVLIDSETASWNMCPKLLSEELEACAERGNLPGAVVVVDVFGQPADYAAITQLCKSYGVPLISDAAESLGASYQGQAAGTLADIGCFSFNGNKIITTSGGGMLVTRNKEQADYVRHLATQARLPEPHYEHAEVGYNYRLSNLLAAIGRGQLSQLCDRVARRRSIFENYYTALGDTPGIEFMPELPGTCANRWLTCLLVDPNVTGVSADTIRQTLEQDNIEARPTWKPMHLQAVNADCRHRGGEVAEDIFHRGICLPSGSSLSQEDQQRVTQRIVECLQANRLTHAA